MNINIHKLGQSGYWIAAGVASTAVLGGCGDKTVDKWENSPGTQGFINLSAVKTAFQKNPEVSEFEKRVNEIFEGDNLIVFEAQRIGKNKGFRYTALEDLNEDGKPSKGDDRVFELVVREGRATLQGYGVNRYFVDNWNYSPPEDRKYNTQPSHYHHRPMFGYWYWYGGWGGGYYTPRNRYNGMRSHRDQYRGGSGFASQVQSNKQYESKMAKARPSSFKKAVNKPSSIRKSYVANKKKSGGFSNSLKKSSSGFSKRSGSSSSRGFSSTRSSGRSGGGFRGSSGFSI
jgi:hypothetical protein